MNTKMKIAQCFLAMVLLCKTCKFPNEGSFFILTNNANHSINHYIEGMYPDTLIVKDKPHLMITQSMTSSKDFDWGTWKERFRELKNDTLSVFIFHTDTLNKYTWDEVRDGYMILKRYDLSFDDIHRLDFISYPPDETMKDVKMFPPFGSE